MHAWSRDEKLGAGITVLIDIAMSAMDGRDDMLREKPPK